jgi:hypothetical protein
LNKKAKKMLYANIGQLIKLDLQNARKLGGENTKVDVNLSLEFEYCNYKGNDIFLVVGIKEIETSSSYFQVNNI